MKHGMKNLNRIGRVLVTAGSLALLSAGCGIVDSKPATSGSEADVSKYYTHIDAKGSQYVFSLANQQEKSLTMTMQGTVASANSTTPVYYCDWKYGNGVSEPWYYTVSPAKAEDLGDTTDFRKNERWVDLQTPLATNSTWKFTYAGEEIIASVIGYGVAAQVNGHTYDDVVQVQYTGTKTTGTRWFARGVGEIYSNMNYGGYPVVAQLSSYTIVK